MADDLCDNPISRFVVLIQTELELEAGYHRHKEAMVYTGLALFTGAVGVALISKDWPPMAWGDHRNWIGALALSLLGFGVLRFLRFQLHMRRRAALRVAGLQNVFAQWATGDLDRNRLTATRMPACDKMSSCQKLTDWVWPQDASVGVMHGVRDPEPYWPCVLVEAWKTVEESGTEAMGNERLIIVSVWGLYVASILGTFW